MIGQSRTLSRSPKWEFICSQAPSNMLPPILGLIALLLLFFKLPQVPEFFGILNCSSCMISTPYVPMLAAAYFSALIVCILSFRTWPEPQFRFAGVIWSIGLAIALTYLSPMWCWICLVAHGCHIAIWFFWRPSQKKPEEMVGLKLSIVFASAIAMMALFSTLNFTFLVYGLQAKNPMHSLVKEGSEIKPFELETIEKRIISERLEEDKGLILHFVSANCAYCKEQIPKLDEIAQEFSDLGFRFVNVGNRILPDLQALGPHLEWAEDMKGNLPAHFGVKGFPTIVVLDPSGVVKRASAGTSKDFEEGLKRELQRLLNEGDSP